MIEVTETQILMTQSEMGIAKDKFMKEHFGKWNLSSNERLHDKWCDINGALCVFISDMFKDTHYHYEEDEQPK